MLQEETTLPRNSSTGWFHMPSRSAVHTAENSGTSTSDTNSCHRASKSNHRDTTPLGVVRSIQVANVIRLSAGRAGKGTHSGIEYGLNGRRMRSGTVMGSESNTRRR